MKQPDDLLSPREPVFSEPWHAQVLATAYSMIDSGQISPDDWANALGAALARAETEGQPDTEETYYLAALDALEQLSTIAEDELRARKAAWESAYRNTPHGKPVILGA